MQLHAFQAAFEIGIADASVSVTDENEIRTRPQPRRNCTAWACGENDVVVIGKLEFFDDRWRRLRFDQSQVDQELIDVRAPVVPLGNKGNLGILSRKVPAERCRQCNYALLSLRGNGSRAGIIEDDAQFALVLAAELAHFERARLGCSLPIYVA